MLTFCLSPLREADTPGIARERPQAHVLGTRVPACACLSQHAINSMKHGALDQITTFLHLGGAKAGAMIPSSHTDT